MNTNTTIPELLVSNNRGIYGFNNINNKIFYCIDGDSFEHKIFNFNRPTPTNPDYKNSSDGCNKNLLSVSNNVLWYYNNSLNDMQNINIDCIYYTKLTNGIPEETLNCLRLPKLNNPIITQTQVNNNTNEINMPYDRFNLITNNDTILFAIGCETNVQKIHYCKLTNGNPNINDSSIWKNTDLPNIQKSNIIELLINDNFIFLIGKNSNENNKSHYEIYYRFIQFNNDNTLKNQWIKFDIGLNLIGLINPKFTINNDILYIYNTHINNRNIENILYWTSLTTNTQNTLVNNNLKSITIFQNANTTIYNLNIYKNILIGNNFDTFFTMELYQKNFPIINNNIIINKINKLFLKIETNTITTTTSNNTTITTIRPNNILTTTTRPNNTLTTTTTTTTTTTRPNNTITTTRPNNTITTTRPNNTITTRANNTTTNNTSGTLLPTARQIPLGNQNNPSLIFGNAFRLGSLLNNDNNINNDNDNDNDNIPMNDIDFEKLSGTNMLIYGKGNTGNFNDFISKNHIFGNKIFYINKN